MSFLNSIWYEKKSLLGSLAMIPLMPLSWIYATIACTRRVMYAKGVLKSSAPAVPVVVVGGITLGGSGKTPLCIALLKELKKRGYHPALISRGYKGSAPSYPMLVEMDSKVEESGDEPLLIKRSVGRDIMVAVDPDRARGAFMLAEKGADVIVTDDGLQHYALDRDVEIVVAETGRMFGNGHLFPAGPLREGLWRLTTIDALVCNGDGVVKTGDYAMHLIPSEPKKFDGTAGVLKEGTEVCAMAGIGNPKRFEDTLRACGYVVKERISVPDHGRVDEAEISRKAKDLPVVMTAKDAVKYRGFENENVYVMNVDAQLNHFFFETVLDKIVSSHNKVTIRADKLNKKIAANQSVHSS